MGRDWGRSLGGFVYEAPPKQRFSVTANRAGLQVARVSWFRLRGSLHRRKGQGVHAEQLARNGLTVIPDFLSPEQWSALQEELPTMRREAKEDQPARPRQRTYEVHAWTPKGFDYRSNVLTRRFLEESGLYALAEGAVGHRIWAPPMITYFEHIYAPEDLGKPMLDLQDNPHVDVPYPSVKAILYLHDTDASNGAFHYARGSHRLTKGRLRAEYRHSILASHARRRGEDHLAGLPVEQFPGEPIAPVEAPANSLVVFNAMGIHRRGDFRDSRAREALFINFRRAGAPINRILAVPPARWALRRFSR